MTSWAPWSQSFPLPSHISHSWPSSSDRCSAGFSIASALMTEALGLHYLIGAFSAGLVIPKSVKNPIMARFEPLAVFVLLPFYFVVTGLKVAIDVGSGQVLLFFLLATLAAMAGKILGTTIPARIGGHRWRDAVHLGVLMQCKGFVEVVILTVFFDAGLISNSAFSALILMALATTALTMPMARAISNPDPVATRGARER
jgi:Kef-type K+ transport system membrane component KefB